MIEIVAKLIREQTPVYLCGETVECFIDFTNPEQDQHKVSQSNSDSFENLAWASVQIHCYRNSTVNEKIDANMNVNKAATNTINRTSLDAANQKKGDVLLATKPKIIFCDLRLNSGQTKSYIYRETLPINGPPTYRGHRIKYYYRITIATQRVNSKVHLLTVPIRVLPLPTDVRPEEIPTLCNETNEELAPTNPFIEKKKTEAPVEIAWHHLQNITARRLPKFYRISNKRGQVGRFCIFKSAYKLGEDIVGTMDFSSRTIRCCQISVTLQCEEILIGNTPAVPELTNGTPSSSQGEQILPAEPTGKITDYTRYHEVCLGMMQTQIVIPVPLYVAPSFSTDLVDVRWRLHFEFVTSESLDFATPDPESGEWRAPLDIPIETMIWNLPVTLYPTAPLQIMTPSGSYSITIK